MPVVTMRYTDPVATYLYGMLADCLRCCMAAGAGQYNTFSGVGKQNLSVKKTLPVFSFGKGTRDASKKV